MTLSPGTRIRRYEVRAVLGVGGMGEVYLAHDVELDRPVALKILPRSGDAHDEERIHRFLQEAKAAIALSHPNVAHIYDAGDENGVRFMAMEYVQGETLRARIARGSLSLEEAIDITLQVASALATAHAAGIVHRDIKPENVMLRPDGYVKVLDFGLAKLTVRDRTPDATEVVHTAPGVVMGTMHYMSPEQLRGDHVDARTDVFSLGVMLCELAGGHRPFHASTASGVIAAILTEEPRLEDVPPELRDVLAKALAKDPDARYATARELASALKKARGDSHSIRSGDIPTQVITHPIAIARPRRWQIAAIALLLVAIAGGAWLFLRQKKIAAARATLPRIEQLAEKARYFEAWDLAKSAHAVLGSDERLRKVMQSISSDLSVATDPAGAQIILQRILADGTAAPRELAGTSPLSKYAIANGEYILRIEKAGYAPVERPMNTMPLRVSPLVVMQQPAPEIQQKLKKKSDVPEGMSFIDGGSYELGGWDVASTATVDLDPFLMDKYEVSNRDFAGFIRAGGYRRRELWKHPFERDGKTLTLEEATALFRDTTGLAGPRNWAQGKYPQGLENHPVTSITWYEAAAYAEHAGKKLPTIYQWDKAARNGARALGWGSVFPWGIAVATEVTRRANFREAGPMPVDSLPSGMSAWGVYHLAGNVTEWLRNSKDNGYATAGGSFDDPVYQFGNIGAYPAWYQSPAVGFRCVRELGGSGRDQGAFALDTRTTERIFHPAGDAEFARLRRVYEYPRTPLHAKVIAREDTSDWVREKITFTGGAGRTAIAYLYLPKGSKPPYQVVHFVPPGDIWRGQRPLPQVVERAAAGIVREGRAILSVVHEGFVERERPGGRGAIESMQDYINCAVDLRRSLDYLASRSDIDLAKIGFFGPSAGTVVGVLVTAVDPRYRAVIFQGFGFETGTGIPPEIDLVNFLPRIAAPKYMIHGRYDEANPVKSNAEPAFALMRGEKRLELFEGGHVPQPEWSLPRIIAFFDKVFGPVSASGSSP
ncbi:MAG TPA: protein kinase [Thermoanaerobaculia bacterium]|nr:protein kinase [Thermoanaerobaculia bacterium]